MTTKAATARKPDLLRPLDPTERHDAMQTRSALLFHVRDRALQLVTCHEVTSSRGAPILGPGRPLAPEDEQALLDLLQSQEDASSTFALLPEHLLHHDRLQTLWWVPSQVRTMHLHNDKGRREISVRWPTLVLLARQRDLFLAAVADDARPTLDTPLFHAPLANVWSDQRLCTGNAPCPLHHDLDAMPLWESVVFDSAFSHQNHTRAIRGSKGKFLDPQHYWPEQDGTDIPFPEAALSPLGLTLGQWPNSLSRGRR